MGVCDPLEQDAIDDIAAQAQTTDTYTVECECCGSGFEINGFSIGEHPDGVPLRCPACEPGHPIGYERTPTPKPQDGDLGDCPLCLGSRLAVDYDDQGWSYYARCADCGLPRAHVSVFDTQS